MRPRTCALLMGVALMLAPCRLLAAACGSGGRCWPPATSTEAAQAEARTEMREGLDAYNDGFYDSGSNRT